MAPYYSFMTGAGIFGCEAQNEDEALQVAAEALNANEDEKDLIKQTMYERAPPGAAATVHPIKGSRPIETK